MDHIARTKINGHNLSGLLAANGKKLPKSIENKMLEDMVENTYGLIEVTETATFNIGVKRVVCRVEWWRTEKKENLQIVPGPSLTKRENWPYESNTSIEIHQNKFFTNGLFVSDFIRTAAMEYYSIALPPDNLRGMCIQSVGMTTVGYLPNLLVFTKFHDRDNAWVVTPLGPVILTMQEYPSIAKSWGNSFWSNIMGKMVDDKNTLAVLRHTKYREFSMTNKNGTFVALNGPVNWLVFPRSLFSAQRVSSVPGPVVWPTVSHIWDW